MRVLIVEHDHARYTRLLNERAPELDHVCADHATSAEIARCQVWLGEPDQMARLLAAGHRPAWVQSTWAGITPLLAEGLPRDYRLSRAVGVFGQVMAEYVLTYILAAQRDVLGRAITQSQRRWDARMPDSLAGREVLIVGVGEIGQRVAEYLVPFGMTVRGIASHARDQAPFAEVAGLDALPRLVAQAEHVVNLLPDTPATQNLFDAALFARFREGAQFLNAGRGSAVVDADLVQALEQGPLGSAVIDVCREEPLPAQHPFWTVPGLLLTGHTAAPTSPPALIEVFLDNLRAFEANQPLQGEVDFERGY